MIHSKKSAYLKSRKGGQWLVRRREAIVGHPASVCGPGEKSELDVMSS